MAGFGGIRGWGNLWGSVGAGIGTGSTTTSARLACGKIAFMGKGLFSPLREDPDTGDFLTTCDTDNVRQCLRDGILTGFGERVMLETMGTIVKELAFEDETIVEDLAVPSIKSFIDNYEPRVLLQNVSVRLQPLSTVDLLYYVITVAYTVRATNTRDNLVFPFFITEDEGI